MWKNFLLKLKESFFSVFPITVVIYAVILCLGIADTKSMILLGISAVLLILGISLFSIGSENSMTELGQNIGSTLSKSKKLWLMIVLSFIIGFMITFAEPDLMVLATQVKDFSTLESVWIFIATVSLGVGLFLILAMLKLVFKWRLSIILAICYTLVLILAFFVPPSFMPIAFDSGSVTTGPISVPFLLAFGLGLSAVRSGKNEDDSFGLIALCSAGPILAVMILSCFLGAGGGDVATEVVQDVGIFQELGGALWTYIKDVALVILPLIVLFVLFQIFAFKFPKQKVVKMLIGFFLTYIGIVVFLTGVECGYLHMGTMLGEHIGTLSYKWIAIPLGLLLGAFAIMAEPALHVLKKQVEDITGGVLKQRVVLTVVSIGVACSVAFAVTQALFNFSVLYIFVPVYIICIALSFFNTKLFTAVAFDSGGVSTGAMAVSFILPLVTGLSAEGASGFGTVGMIAVFPILTMQILGCIYKIVLLRNKAKERKKSESKIEIIEFDYDWGNNDEPVDNIKN